MMPFGSSLRPPHRIAIVGAGFTGSMLAAHLLRRCEQPTTIHLIERSGAPGPGLAYSTPNGAHVLNVRAYNMSAYPDDPRHFLRWLWARNSDSPVPPSGHAFVSRAVYGAYIRDVLAQAQAAAPPHVAVRTLRAEAVDVVEEGDGVRLRLDGGPMLPADRAVLCLGNFPPPPPRVAADPQAAAAVFASSRYIGDPWDHAAVAAVPPDEAVLVLGTGLTMVDVVLSLLDQGHRGAILAVSRRGLLPTVHEETRPYKSFLCPQVMPRTVLDVLIALKADARRAQAAGFDWRAAFDALRPHHHRIWEHLPEEERRRFLRHARPFWEVHRHRLAPEVAARIAAARASGQLSVRAGRLHGLSPDGDGVAAAIAERGGAIDARRVGRVINATGSECDYARIRHPLVQALLRRGLARPDPLRLGLDVTADGALIGASGRPSDRLFALGPASRAPFWEMTAVPELRTQCAGAAEHLAAFPAERVHGMPWARRDDAAGHPGREA
ncbi:FAD/NAD(P)-binding protein [Azospirillum sp.]|uniref:FAD/NAD(P)-binding protein n=1 Tax=Azospirillum sp. TaxID=34012 RepID=UPI002D2648FA|nr:FAD/NAD(P)-binding protein [Azospirillum sp.]HYD66983.1 FAD/NAD(P)-binding protein [Azospirillum sp.]